MIWLKNVEEFVENKEWYYRMFLKFYRSRVEEFYAEEYAEHPETFPFMKSTKSITVFRDYGMITFLLNAESNTDEHYSKIDGMNSYEEYEEISRLPSYIKEKRLLEIAGIDGYIEKDLSYYGESDHPVPEYREDVALYQGNTYADKHYEITNKYKEKKQIDISIALEKYNDPQFRYELEEAAKAYSLDLYLASTVTAAVALETLLKSIIVNKLGVKFIPVNNKFRHTLQYAKILQENHLIEERLFHRIQSMNELRRSGAHSKSGEMKKWDAEQFLSGINEVVTALFPK